jgi:glycosyltransferase involved in cell wall biosynthesis
MSVPRDPSLREPLVSILICTWNRKANIVTTIESVRACGYARFELFILDQSDNDDTELAVSELCQKDDRLVYLRLRRPSKPLALNHGRLLAKGSYIVLTDDDCEACPGWIAPMVQVFETDQRIGCVFGDVEAAPHDEATGFIPICKITDAHVIFSLSDLLTMPGLGNFGMGANMALRASALTEIGGWDPHIGPGARFKSGDDNDVGARMLAAGYGVAFCPASRTIHYGLRRWESAGKDQARYGFGLGAIFMKHLRCGSYYPGPARVAVDGAMRAARRLRQGQRPQGGAFLKSWVAGAWRGMTQPIDRSTRCYQSGDDDEVVGENRVAEVVLRANQGDSKHDQAREGSDA